MDCRNRRVLFVDDEPLLLDAMLRKLHGRFEVTTAESGASGLELLARTEAPFAVIVSDMRMPRMNGAVFLARARELTAPSSRLLLTGDTNLQSAIAAVNEGNIFRFLCKPCPPEVLLAALEAGTAQHELLTNERDIMERTLSAVVKTLADVLSLSEPELFERALVVKGYVSHVVRRLAMEGAWQIEVAASLHTLGLIALPAELARRAPSATPLTIEQKRQLTSHPETGRRILHAIPRLEEVALIVGQQATEPEQGSAWLQRGARLLKIAIRVEERVARGLTLRDALDALNVAGNEDDQLFVDTLRTLYSDPERSEWKELRVRDLGPGMILASDVKTRDGALVLTKGHELSEVLLARLTQFAASRGIQEPVLVQIPSAAN
jgi:CheY-like chemotaxis protein